MELFKPSGVYLDEVIPFQWKLSSSQEEALLPEYLLQQNIERLKMIVNLTEHSPPVEHEEDHAVMQELQRIDSKVNLLIKLVGQLMCAGGAQPQARRLVLFNDRLICSLAEEELPKAGHSGQIEVFLNPMFPFSVTLACTVTEVACEQGRCAFMADLLPVADEFSDLLEKYIFRAHRRQIARSRKGH